MDLQAPCLVNRLIKILPPTAEKEHRGTKEHIEEFGLLDGITIRRSQIAGGFHRLLAYMELGIVIAH